MAQLMTRLHAAVSALGNAGAVANVHAALARIAADRCEVEQLELRMAASSSIAARRAA